MNTCLRDVCTDNVLGLKKNVQDVVLRRYETGTLKSYDLHIIAEC